MSDLQPGQMLGPYQIIEQVGKGGMASVYKAYHAATDRYVAIKILPQQLASSPEFLGRFQLEARLIAKLEHAHILPVHDYGEIEGIPYLVMRYLDAGTLADRIQIGPIPLEEIDHIFTQLADALGYAHKQGVYHRDVKPANALIDGEGNVFLTDFGIAKLAEGISRFTITGVVAGTPLYMSPEHAKGDSVDQRTDIYSLGVVLFEMLTGKAPFDGETAISILLKKIQEPLPLLSRIRSDIHPAVEAIVVKAMATNPNDRFNTMQEFRKAWKQAVCIWVEANRAEISAAMAKADAAVFVQVSATGSGISARAVPGPGQTTSVEKNIADIAIKLPHIPRQPQKIPHKTSRVWLVAGLGVLFMIILLTGLLVSIAIQGGLPLAWFIPTATQTPSPTMTPPTLTPARLLPTRILPLLQNLGTTVASSQAGLPIVNMTCQELIAAMPEIYNAKAAPPGFEGDIQFRIIGSEPGDYYLHIQRGQCTYQQGLSNHPMLTITTPCEIWKGILMRQMTGERVLSQKLLHLQGDTGIFLQLNKMFDAQP